MRSAIAHVLSLTILATSPALVTATTWHVPSDQPTIQAGLNAAGVGDTVVVACGTYVERNIDSFNKSGVVLTSETGDADCVVIDGQNLTPEIFHTQNWDADCVVRGLTFANGRTGGASTPGGAWLELNSNMTVENCRFVNCAGEAGVLVDGSSDVVFRNCVFEGNSGEAAGAVKAVGTSAFEKCVFLENDSYGFGGGAVYAEHVSDFVDCTFIRNDGVKGGAIWASTLSVSGCTFYDNVGGEGGAIVVVGGQISLDHSIIAFNRSTVPVFCFQATLTSMSCCDVFGNEAGDYVQCLAGRDGANGNFSADPMFCDPGTDNLWLHLDSPCAPGNDPQGGACGLIGANSVRCGGELPALPGHGVALLLASLGIAGSAVLFARRAQRPTS